jgi:hypothetical protein
MWSFFSSRRRKARLARDAQASLPAVPTTACELCGAAVVTTDYRHHYDTHVRRVLSEKRPLDNEGEAYREGQPVRQNIDVYLVETRGHGDDDGWKRYSLFYAKAVAKLHAAYPPTAEFQCLPQRYWFAKSLGALLVIIRY